MLAQNDVEMKNALAVKTVKQHGVTLIDDLYTAVTDVCGKVYKNCPLCDDESKAHPGGKCGFHYSPAGWRLLANQTASFIKSAMKSDDHLASSVLVEAHCNSALRIRVAPPGAAVLKGAIGALSEVCGGGAQAVRSRRLVGPGEVSNGNVKAVVTATTLTVTRISDGLKLLSGPLPTFGTARCGPGFHSINASFVTGASSNSWYGLGQLGSSEATGGQPNCEDNSPASARCVVPLERGQLGPVSAPSCSLRCRRSRSLTGRCFCRRCH